MHWHGFLVKFMLWIAAAGHIFQAYWIFTGRFYYQDTIRDAIYAALPGLRFVDYGFAALLCIGAILLLIARHLLARRRRAGIKSLYAAYMLLAAAPAAHVLTRFGISLMPPLNLSALAQVMACLMLLMINFLYYRRRRELFE